MVNKVVLTAAIALFSSVTLAQGEYIATNATITKVGNTAGNEASFWVVAENGTGPCVTTGTQNNIYFPKSAAGTEKIFDRAYSAALAALASGKPVNIYNYLDGTCNTAVAIEVLAN
ncbi:DUF5992 family protein [Microbulbifer sp. DLAB2-AF]|uniref:DUF5992 family protein n=1 Tax=Microbulbifer sp. DLAB2-AF TaxID=3243395 RepID=UPI004039A97C